ncbi:MAG: NAD(P)/FAD-dependent oxidoreductase [Halieaceae bacterium]|nr:NAD(P)/FAD-dependent oxidoreductase [Halieaceae bacterium]
MNQPKQKNVVVIGAGASGLTAAHRLRQAGVDVTILEASDKASGRVQSLQKNGYIMDVGADVCTDGYHTYLELADELGLDDKRHMLPTNIGSVVSGKVRYIDTASMISMATSSVFSWRTKFELAKGMKKVAPDIEAIDYSHLYKSAHLDDPHRSAEVYGLRNFGPGATDYLLDPLCRLVHATGAEQTSILDVITGLSLANSKTWTFLGGSDLLLKTLASQLPVQYHCRVTQVQDSESRVTVDYVNAEGEAVTLEADACVLAIMYEDMLEVYPKLIPLSQELYDNLSYIDVCKVHLGYKAVTNTDAYTVQVPSCEDAEMFLLFLDHNKAPDRAPAGHSLMNVQSDVRVADEMAARTDEEMVDWAREKVENLYSELAGHFDGTWNVARWPRLGNRNYPGYYRNVAKFIERLDKDSRVQLAGDMFTKTSQEAAASRGQLVADTLVSVLG